MNLPESTGFMEIPEHKSAELARNDTVRPMKLVLKSLGYEVADLANQSVLDLGSGPEQVLAEQLQTESPNSLVIAYDYALGAPQVPADISETEYRQKFSQVYNKEYAEQTNPRIKKGLKSVAGLFSELPFLSNSFDKVISYTAVPNYLHSIAEMEQAYAEIIRVLKPGGQYRGYPAEYTEIERVTSDEASSGDRFDDIFSEFDLDEDMLKTLQEKFAGQAKIEVVANRLIIKKIMP